MDAQHALTAPSENPCPFSDRPGSRTATPETVSLYSIPSASYSSHETVTTQRTSEHETDRSCPVIFTQEVDPLLIKTSLDDRIAYLTDYLNFTSHDSDTLRKIAPHVTNIIPSLVDDLYAKLFEFDITKKVFMTRNQGFDGPLPTKLEDLTLDSAQITFRKVFMKSWARRVLTSDYSNGKTWVYMDKVGIMHTGHSPFKHQKTMGIKPLNVPYRDCALTLGWIQTILNTAILQLPDSVAPLSLKTDAITAIGKVIWIQNDLFSRHYIDE